ncbi:lysylphosphatidylglycerol synthase transmembrane domain-containing protein [Listeria sp. PSOL-1]|uniref:lysylphosphatidylglycerol synthase transmembrane domain-containing protein n=1 Tax=Listeria sp. PSOL-1 TaxID=1844999 RepID=UPI0013D25D3C|nr:lysylphosphatidylglycerol synthase transmembrane domain-containing protein [Listeria sp. PSOL-1]
MNRSARRNTFNIFIILVISIGYIVWQFRDVKLHSFLKDLEHVNLWWILIAFICMAFSWIFEAIVLHNTVKPSKPDQHFFSSFRITMGGQFFNMITPMQTGGQPAQLFMLTRQGMDAGAASSVLLIKFIIYQAMIVINFIVVLIFGFHYLMTDVIQVKFLVITGFLVHSAVIVGLIFVAKSQRVTTKIVHFLFIPIAWVIKKERSNRMKQLIDEKIASFHVEIERISKDRKIIFKASFYTTLQLWIYFTIPYFILIGIGVHDVSLYMAITFHAFIMMFATVMPTPGGSGGAEYTFTLLLTGFMSSVKLLTALLIWRIITYYSCIIFGGIALMIRDKRTVLKRKTIKKSLGNNLIH